MLVDRNMRTRPLSYASSAIKPLAIGLCLAMVSIIAGSSLAQQANFSAISLAPGFEHNQARMRGFTRGSFSLPAIANQDRHGNFCLGYAASTPDHVFQLEAPFNQLTVQVDSRGNAMTLLIQGPNETTIRCSSSHPRQGHNGITLQDQDWAAGTYQVWVGSVEQGQRYDYVLTIQE